MTTEERLIIVENYYRATNALMTIGTMKNIPKDLLELSLNASRAVTKIIAYVNDHKEDES